MIGVLRGCRVLIVEDDYFIAADLAEALQGLGAIIVGPNNSVKGGLRLLSEVDPQAAVLDINLGREAVYPLADELLARAIPFIFATGYSSDAIPSRYHNVPRCQKPLQAPAVAQLLAQELRQKATR